MTDTRRSSFPGEGVYGRHVQFLMNGASLNVLNDALAYGDYRRERDAMHAELRAHAASVVNTQNVFGK